MLIYLLGLLFQPGNEGVYAFHYSKSQISISVNGERETNSIILWMKCINSVHWVFTCIATNPRVRWRNDEGRTETGILALVCIMKLWSWNMEKNADRCAALYGFISLTGKCFRGEPCGVYRVIQSVANCERRMVETRKSERITIGFKISRHRCNPIRKTKYSMNYVDTIWSQYGMEFYSHSYNNSLASFDNLLYYYFSTWRQMLLEMLSLTY
jgi:hypothetical protein